MTSYIFEFNRCVVLILNGQFMGSVTVAFIDRYMDIRARARAYVRTYVLNSTMTAECVSAFQDKCKRFGLDLEQVL